MSVGDHIGLAVGGPRRWLTEPPLRSGSRGAADAPTPEGPPVPVFLSRGALTWSGSSRRAADLLDTLHERHVPITPALATALAGMADAREPAADRPWGQTWDLAGAAIGLAGRFGRTGRWGALLDVFVAVVAEPLLRQASRRAGVAPLTLVGGRMPDEDTAAWEAAAGRIEDEVKRLLEDPAAAHPGFWSHAGLSLLGAYRHRVGQSTGLPARHLPPQTEPVMGHLVFEVEPELPRDEPWKRKQISSSAKAERFRTGYRPREGGVQGIVHSRRLEDIGSALASSFAFPPQLLAARLVDEGFFIPHRPPMRRPKRDMLWLTFNEEPLWAGPAAVAKAAWVDAAMRLGLLLSGFGVPKTEMGWSDRMEAGPGASAISMDGRRQALAGSQSALALSGRVRRTAIATSALMPDAFSARPNGRWGMSDTAAMRRRFATRHLIAACSKAAATTAAVQAGAAKGRDTPAPWETAPDFGPDDYAVVLLTAIRPGTVEAGRRESDWSLDRLEILADHGISEARSQLVAEVILPDEVAPGAAFRVVSDVNEAPTAFQIAADEPEEVAKARIIGELSDWFIDQVVQTIHAS